MRARDKRTVTEKHRVLMLYRLKKIKENVGGGGEGCTSEESQESQVLQQDGVEPINYIQAWPWFK